MTVLVTGATGGVGRHVVRELLRAGEPVRAVTRVPEKAMLPHGVDLVRGDLTQPGSLRPALEDIDRIYLFPIAETARAIVDLAREAGVRRFVVLSSISAEKEDGDLSSNLHRPVENAVEASGVEWTHVRPGAFMNNMLNWAPSIRAESVVREPYGQAPSAMVHEADIADVAVAALLEEGHRGAAYTLTGPESLTKIDQVRILGEVLGRDIGFEELTPAQARQVWIDRGVPAGTADWLVQEPESTAPVGPTAEQVTGRPARTFAQWVADHRADF